MDLIPSVNYQFGQVDPSKTSSNHNVRMDRLIMDPVVEEEGVGIGDLMDLLDMEDHLVNSDVRNGLELVAELTISICT